MPIWQLCANLLIPNCLRSNFSYSPLAALELYVKDSNSTHWKKEYDEQTGQIVFKKKMAYSSEEEANKAVMEWQKDHPEDKREITAYKCAICKKWHIGHKSDMKECTENGDSVQKVALPLHKK